MRATQTEAAYYPAEPLQPGRIQSVLCIAPHPDDEILGCGGLLAQLAASLCRVEVLILSGGENATGTQSPELAERRRQESLRAARVLGLPEPAFLQLPDRGMQYAEPLIETIKSALERSAPQYLLLPSLSEPHPDHQAVALAGLAAAQRSRFPQTVLFYEVGAPLHPNSILDISKTADLKWQALDEFTSQEAIQPYKVHSQALGVLRAFGRGAGCTHAEAFFQVDAASLRASGASVALPFWPAVRVRQHLVNSPQQLPLVSVLIRSMDRSQLSEAIACVAMQTYPHIELVVVNASGRPHSPVQYPRHRLAFQLVEPGEPGPPGAAAGQPGDCVSLPASGRPQAANLALRAARGELALFLDDDDLLEPNHIERLVDALAANPQAMAAYAGVRVDGQAGPGLRIYDLPWSPHRLKGINFLPIHAVVFRLDCVRQSAQSFDESLPVLEDWDFWRKLAQAGEFVHCPGVSAVYRQNHGASKIGDSEHENHWLRWHLLLTERYLQGNSPAENAKTMAWHAIELDKQQAHTERLLAEKDTQRQRVEELTAAVGNLTNDIDGKQRANDGLAQQNTAIGQQHSLLALECEGLKAIQATLEAHNHALMEQLDGLQNDLIYLRDALENAGQQRDALNALHQARSDACLQAEALCSRLQAEKAYLQSEMLLVKNSRSWKLTRPMRVLNRWLGKSAP